MTKGAASRLTSLCSFILIIWGVCYLIFFGSLLGSYSALTPSLLRLESVSKGILFIYTGLVIFHLPSLVRRGEYQALRIMTFTLTFLIALTVWHFLKSPSEELLLKATPIVLALSSLLLLIAIIQFRQSRRLPRF